MSARDRQISIPNVIRRVMEHLTVVSIGGAIPCAADLCVRNNTASTTLYLPIKVVCIYEIGNTLTIFPL